VLPDVVIGERCRIRKTVIDKGCDIRPGMIIGEDREQDRQRFEITPEGVVMVTAEMLGQELHHVR
jgi:glucose-1-phosphate adenylyltransferase